VAIVAKLRDFHEGDQERVRRLILDGLADHWGTIDDALNPDLDDIAVSYAPGRTIVAETDGELVGTGTLMPVEPSVAEILRMSVHASFRRRGIGRALVNELVQTALGWGARKVVLETSSSWTDVVSFYVACGFTITGTQDGRFGEDTWFELPL
jgi:GNAT superfamily N-acetyltransferase